MLAAGGRAQPGDVERRGHRRTRARRPHRGPVRPDLGLRLRRRDLRASPSCFVLHRCARLRPTPPTRASRRAGRRSRRASASCGAAGCCSRRSPSTSSRWSSACRGPCSRGLAVVQFHRGPEVVGLLFSALSVGALIGALTSGWVGTVRRPGPRHPRRGDDLGTRRGRLRALGERTSGLRSSFSRSRAPPMSSPPCSATRRSNCIVPDALRGRLSALNILVVAGGPRLGDFEGGRSRARFLAVHRGRVRWVLCLVGVGVIAAACRSSRAGGSAIRVMRTWHRDRCSGRAHRSRLTRRRVGAIDSDSWLDIRGRRCRRSSASPKGHGSRSSARPRFRTRADAVADRRAHAQAAAFESRCRRVLRDASRGVRASLPAARRGVALRRRSLDRVAEAHRGCRDRSLRTHRARGRTRARSRRQQGVRGRRRLVGPAVRLPPLRPSAGTASQRRVRRATGLERCAADAR